MPPRLFSICLVTAALAAGSGCEAQAPSPPPALDAAQDLSRDFAPPADLSRASDLAQHLVSLPAPTALSVAYQRTPTGALAQIRWARAADLRATHVRLLRRAVDLPTGPFDPLSTLVYEGQGEAAAHAVRQLVALETSIYAVFSCDDEGGCEDAGVQVPFAVTLMQALADGGYTIYLRHAADALCADALALGTAMHTTSPGWWMSCDQDCASATARQLDPSGVARATELGDTLRGRGVPIGRVQTSELCRAVQTAQLLSLGPMIERDPDLSYFVYDESLRCATSRARIAESPPPGQNTLLIGHTGFPSPCAPLDGLGFLDAAVHQPSPAMSGHARFIEILRASEWATVP